MRITKIESQLISLMNKIPILSYYANSRGWTFLISWGHRLAGLTLVGYMLAHIYTLSLLFTPATFDADMKFLHNFIFTFLEWAVAVPVIFHSLNGGRLMLYELFHVRAEELMIRSMAVLGLIYILLVGVFFIQGGPQLSATAFWSITVVISLIVCFFVFKKIWITRNSMLWKLQRVTGVFSRPARMSRFTCRVRSKSWGLLRWLAMAAISRFSAGACRRKRFACGQHCP